MTIIFCSLMTKLFGCLVEAKLSGKAKKNGERTYQQASFQKHRSTMDNLGTFLLIMEETFRRCEIVL